MGTGRPWTAAWYDCSWSQWPRWMSSSADSHSVAIELRVARISGSAVGWSASMSRNMPTSSLTGAVPAGDSSALALSAATATALSSWQSLVSSLASPSTMPLEAGPTTATQLGGGTDTEALAWPSPAPARSWPAMCTRAQCSGPSTPLRSASEVVVSEPESSARCVSSCSWRVEMSSSVRPLPSRLLIRLRSSARRLSQSFPNHLQSSSCSSMRRVILLQRRTCSVCAAPPPSPAS
mmetsp:Transcript_19122/g.53989  ORF Transcript_19122/g.53989 Transcript_19122/m.53989 type:complete len:236 (+) Transcript_19122:463-1170(+)